VVNQKLRKSQEGDCLKFACQTNQFIFCISIFVISIQFYRSKVPLASI